MEATAVGERISRAREFLGLTQAAVAHTMGLARTTQVAIEQGRRPASIAELCRYAEVLSRPLDYFLGAGVWAGSDLRPVFRRVSDSLDAFDLGSGEAAPTEKLAVARFEWLCRHYRELEELNGLPRAEMPRLPAPRHRSGLEAEQLAATVRAYLDIGPDVPIRDLRVRLEEVFALRVFLQAETGRLSAVGFHDPTVGACVLLAQRPMARMRFTLAHALGHLLADRAEPVVDIHEGNRRTALEAFATHFAGALLVPARSLRERHSAVHREAAEFNDIALLFLARTYGVSLKALRSRLESLKLVTPSRLKKIDAAIAEANGAQVEVESTTTLALPDQHGWDALPERYLFLALRAYRKGLVDRSRLGELMGTDEEGTANRLLRYLASVRDAWRPEEP